VNWWLLACGVLMVGGLGPALRLGASGRPVQRLVGLQLAGAVVVPAMMLLAQGLGQSQYLIVPLVLVVVSFTGTLVFTRLLGPDR
jgi:multisubunit Na+/H+ antiporter MnhF subunit